MSSSSSAITIRLIHHYTYYKNLCITERRLSKSSPRPPACEEEETHTYYTFLCPPLWRIRGCTYIIVYYNYIKFLVVVDAGTGENNENTKQREIERCF